MARMIDAEKYMELLKEQYLHHKSMGDSKEARAWQGAMQLLYDMPTLTPPNESRMINADKLAKRIAGHSNYHGDSILAAIYCAAEGKENDTPIRPIETSPNEWVSVDERLPEDGERVIATDGCFTGEAYIDCYGVWCRSNGMRWNMFKTDVTHWMPLPYRL